MREHLAAFLRHLDGAHRSHRTIGSYRAIVAALAGFAQGPPDRATIEAFLSRRRSDGGPRSAATRNQELAAVRSFAKFGIRELGWTTNPTDGIPFVREPPRDPPVLSLDEMRRLFLAVVRVAAPSEQARDLAMIAVLAQTGLRVHELVALDDSQVDLASATLVGVRGKGGTVHDLPLNAPTIALTTAWLRERRANEGEPALFTSRRGGRISVRTVQRLLVRLRSAMGSVKKITPHTLRHSCATLALTLGSDLSTVGDLLRHADLNVTRRYLHLVDERRREAVRGLAAAIPRTLVPGAAGPNGSTVPTPPKTTNIKPASNVTPRKMRLDAQHGLDDVDRAA